MTKILITAAYGNQGKLLLPRFRAAGFSIRALRATPGHDDQVKALGATEVVIGSAADREVLRKAVSGIDVIYHIGPTAHPLERDMGFAIVDAARDANIRHFIYSSVLHPIATKMIQHKLKMEVEEHLLEANIPFTVLQPADYMLPGVFAAAFQNKVWMQLFDLDRVQAMVALEDVADVALQVATEGSAHFGATYQLCSPGNFSGNHIATLISTLTGEKVGAELVSADDYFERFYRIGRGDQFRYPLALIRAVALWYGQYDFLGNPNVLTWLLGRRPTTVEQYIKRQWQIWCKDQPQTPP